VCVAKPPHVILWVRTHISCPSGWHEVVFVF